MRRALAVAAVLVSVASAAAAFAAPVRTAFVAVSSLDPFTVHGARFQSGERVTVTAFANGRHVRTVTASSAGAFAVAFRGVAVDRCAGYVVRAVGNRGSRAAIKVMPECAPLQGVDGLTPSDPVPKKP